MSHFSFPHKFSLFMRWFLFFLILLQCSFSFFLLWAHSIRLWIFPQCLNPIQHKNNTTHLRSIFCRLRYIKKSFPFHNLPPALPSFALFSFSHSLTLNAHHIPPSLPTTHPFSLTLSHKCDIEFFYILFYCVHISFLHWALMMGKTPASRIATTTTTTSCRSFENNINIFVHFFKWIDDNNGKQQAK